MSRPARAFAPLSFPSSPSPSLLPRPTLFQRPSHQRPALRQPFLHLQPRPRPFCPARTQSSLYSTGLPRTVTNVRLVPLIEVLVVVHNRGRARVRRTVSFLIISSVSFLVGGYFALSYAPPILTPWIMGSMPTDEETLSLYDPPDDFSREVDEHIKSCALAQELRSNPAYTESRPHLKIPEAIRAHNLTGGTLSGPGMIVVPPYMWNEEDGKSMVSIFYLGNDVTGHPGIVHGGLLATMLDEGLARCCFSALPNKVGVTANLQINYRKPTMAGQFLVLKAKTTKVDGRKAWVEGWIEPLHPDAPEQPEKLVEATGLFVEPRHAPILKSLYKVT